MRTHPNRLWTPGFWSQPGAQARQHSERVADTLFADARDPRLLVIQLRDSDLVFADDADVDLD